MQSQLPQIAIVGTEGSGKTVLATVWAKKMSLRQDGTFLNSKGMKTGMYVEQAWAALNNGEWLPSTPPGQKFELEWNLHIGNVVYPVKLVDVAGQDLRNLFSYERHKEANLSEHERGVLNYLANSSIVVIVVNLQDFTGEPDAVKRAENELILKEIIDMYSVDAKHQDIAVVFTAYDLYRVEMEKRHGSFANYVKNELPTLVNTARAGAKSGDNIKFFPAAAVAETEIRLENSGVHRVPKKNFKSFGLDKLSDWILDNVQKLARQDAEKQEAVRREEAEREAAVQDAADWAELLKQIVGAVIGLVIGAIAGGVTGLLFGGGFMCLVGAVIGLAVGGGVGGFISWCIGTLKKAKGGQQETTVSSQENTTKETHHEEGQNSKQETTEQEAIGKEITHWTAEQEAADQEAAKQAAAWEAEREATKREIAKWEAEWAERQKKNK
ncbi:MAG: hypothetical protein LBJ67_11850 [Planctomycetaceae bacterium]|nr:hypothetical protein [Planctomycetaceae bacterium]